MSSSFEEGSCSEYIEEIKNLNNENKQLKNTNTQLFQELSNLRSQFREKSKTIENSNIQNDKLEEKVRNLEDENNKLTTKLKETQVILNDFNEKQSQEKETLNSTSKSFKELTDSKFTDENTDENFYFENPISNSKKMNNDNQLQIDQLKSENEQIKIKFDEQVKKNELFRRKNKIIVETFSKYFKKKFQTINQLINYTRKEIQNPSNKGTQNQENENENANHSENENTNHLENENANHSENENINNSESENFNDFKQKMEAEKLKLEIKLKKIENDAIQAKHDIEINEIKNKQEIEEKNKKITSLENENSFLKQQISRMNTSIHSISAPLYLPNSDKQESQLAILQQTLSETSKELQNSQNENKDISRQLANIKSEYDELFDKIENKNQELIKLRIDRDNFEGKYNATFAQIQIEKTNNQKLTTSLSDTNRKFKSAQDSIAKFEKLIELQKNEICQLTNDRKVLSSLVFNIKNVFQKEEDIYQKILAENKSYKKNLKSIKSTIDTIKTKSPSDNLTNSIPITSWYCINFDEELCNLISEIASNDGISDTVKLKHVFQIISNYYNRKINELNNENKKELEKQTSQNSTTSEFIVSIAEDIGIEDFQPEYITNPFKICDIKQKLLSITNECENLQKSNNQYSSLLDIVSEKLHSTYEEIPNKVDSMMTFTDNLQNELTKAQNKCKEEKQEFTKKLENLNSKNTKTNRQKDLTIGKLKAVNTRLSTQIKELNKKLEENNQKQTKSKNKSIENNDYSYDDNYSNRNDNDYSADNNNRKLQVSHIELNNQINEKDNLIQLKDKEIKRLEDEVTFWKENLEAVKILQYKKEADDQKAKEYNEEILLSTKKKFQNEKDEIIKQYEQILSNIKKQNLELKNVIETMSTSIINSETKITNLKDKNSQLFKEKESIESQLNSQKEELNRQKFLNSQKLKACQIANESGSKNALADLQSQFSAEKRKIYCFAIHLFHNFYNIEKKIDESVYKETLTKANDQLNKLTDLEKSVRELLGISNNESIEANISSLLSKLYQK